MSKYLTPQMEADLLLQEWQAQRFERAAAKRLGQRVFTAWLIALWAVLILIVLSVGYWADPLRQTADIHRADFTCPEVALPSARWQVAKRKQRSFIQCAIYSENF